MPKKFSKPHLSRIINGDVVLPSPPEADPKTRLDVALQAKYPQFNRSTIKKYIKAGQALINQQSVTKPNTLVADTDQLDLQLLAPSALPKVPIIFENDDVIVMDKPAGLLTISKGDFNPEPTLEVYGQIVHRLDRDTSGVIILAKNSAAKTHLQKQFQDRKAHKIYHAVVVGRPKHPAAVINVPLARNLKQPTTFQPDPAGRVAVTAYQTLGTSDKYTLLELKPTTGRTHQLRVHLAHIGTPILGDKVYGHTPASRMFLHAASLEITLPGGQRQTFTSKTPSEFQDVLK